MKLRFLILIFIFGSTFLIFAQESEKNAKLSPEFKVSFNMNNSRLGIGSFGFGVGAYNAFFNQKRCNLIVGVEYNALFKQYMQLDVFKYFLSVVGIPVLCRVNIGKTVKFFVDAGAFFDPLFIVKSEVNEIRETIYYKPDFGLSLGVGLRIPVKKYEILIKADRKFSMGELIYLSPSIHNSYWSFAVGFKM
jgi:hypothetical protein